MDKYKDYVCKGNYGHEAPVKTQMAIYITNPNRKDRPQMLNVVFYNYLSEIADQRYVSWKIDRDRIYFRFDRDNMNIHTYKMFNTGSGNVGEPLAINVYKQPDAGEVKRFCSSLKYPVYYSKSTDEYFIKLEDTKRKPLFTNKTQKVLKLKGGKKYENTVE